MIRRIETTTTRWEKNAIILQILFFEVLTILTSTGLKDYMVVSHAPTMTVSLDREGRNMLTKLKEEAEALGSSITMVYSDRCCDVSFSKHLTYHLAEISI